ncbi:uncharacterized protein LOC124970799 [Sciurus carolinensis]|uniref:uncharacterized protein LOC124970799 n=1 Tax=Sciurus carolinensis TaxID=30640 RepID=UPI001FB54CB9|nr:uncharacterized protein LOC124970799 [Sciurus carolinensis]
MQTLSSGCHLILAATVPRGRRQKAKRPSVDSGPSDKNERHTGSPALGLCFLLTARLGLGPLLASIWALESQRSYGTGTKRDPGDDTMLLSLEIRPRGRMGAKHTTGNCRPPPAKRPAQGPRPGVCCPRAAARPSCTRREARLKAGAGLRGWQEIRGRSSVRDWDTPRDRDLGMALLGVCKAAAADNWVVPAGPAGYLEGATPRSHSAILHGPP